MRKAGPAARAQGQNGLVTLVKPEGISGTCDNVAIFRVELRVASGTSAE